MEELLGQASPRDPKNCSGHTALIDTERPGPGSGQSGGRDVELEAGSPDLVAGHHPGLPVTLGRPLTSETSASHLFPGDKTTPVLSAHGWPRGSNNGKIL